MAGLTSESVQALLLHLPRDLYGSRWRISGGCEDYRVGLQKGRRGELMELLELSEPSDEIREIIRRGLKV